MSSRNSFVASSNTLSKRYSRRMLLCHSLARNGSLNTPGEAVRRYGQIIGFATQPIAPGEWVHTHNMAMGDFARDYAWGVDARATALAEVPEVFQVDSQRIHHLSHLLMGLVWLAADQGSAPWQPPP